MISNVKKIHSLYSPQLCFLNTLPGSQTSSKFLKITCKFNASFAISSFVLLFNKFNFPDFDNDSSFSFNFCIPSRGLSKYSSIIFPILNDILCSKIINAEICFKFLSKNFFSNDTFYYDT